VMKLQEGPTRESYASWQRSGAVGSCTLYGQRKDAEDMRYLILATACHNKQVVLGS
jgi:hypothetical protein